MRVITKKILIYTICFCFLASSIGPVAAKDEVNTSSQTNSKYIFQGHAEINEGAPKKDIFTGEKGGVKQGSTINMTVSSVLSAGYSETGDEFFAEITDDVRSIKGVVIPASSIAHGKITTLSDSKRLGRDGYITINFDYIITPDGRELPIEASMTTKKNPAASVAQVALEDTGYTLAGGVVGGLTALRVFGLSSAVASHGYTVAGGAGVGAVVGLGIGLGRKGEEVLIAPGDMIKVKIDGALELPIISENALKEEEINFNGLDIKIVNYKIEEDPFGEPNTITLALTIKNNTDKTFSTFDMALINDYKAIFYPSPFGNDDFWFQKISPKSYVAGKISFAVDNAKRKHWLVFYDARTRKPLTRISVDNAKRDIEKWQKENKKKK